METRLAETPSELLEIAKDILKLCGEQNMNVVGLRGELGAGKTALTKAIAKELGIEEDITSPTFVVMKSYPISKHPLFKKLVHIDAYRIESEDEMRVLKFDEILHDSENLVVIEWPERIQNLLPKNTLHISIEIKEGETRELTFHGN